MKFDEILGQKRVLRILKKSIKEDRISHAYAFCGEPGIGKKKVAMAFAHALLCIGNQGEPWMDCIGCKTFTAGTNPDFFFLNPTGSIQVEELRNFLKDLYVKPMYGEKKVYILNLADQMTVSAQNSFLKSLEEPPPSAVMILLTSRYDALLPTIQSRVFKIELDKNSEEEVKVAIQKHFPEFAEPDFIVRFARGNIGAALKFAGDREFLNLREDVFRFVMNLNERKMGNLFSLAHFFEKNKEQIDVVLDLFTLFLRDILVLKTSGDEKLLINIDKKDMMLNKANTFSEEKIPEAIGNIESVRGGLSQNANYALAVQYLTLLLQEQ